MVEYFQPGKILMSEFVNSDAIEPLGRFAITNSGLEQPTPDGQQKLFTIGTDVEAYKGPVRSGDTLTRGLILSDFKGNIHALPDFDFSHALQESRTQTFPDPGFGWETDVAKVTRNPALLSPVDMEAEMTEVTDRWSTPVIGEGLVIFDPAESRSTEEPTVVQIFVAHLPNAQIQEPAVVAAD